MARTGAARAERSAIGERLVFPAAVGQWCSKPRCWNAASLASGCSLCAGARTFLHALERIGHMPLPPYIRRDDAEVGSRALSDGLCARARLGGCADGGAALHAGDAGSDRRAGVEIARVTLHVGLGTFAPLRVEQRGRGAAAPRALHDFAGDTAEAVNRAQARRPAHRRRGHHGSAHPGGSARKWLERSPLEAHTGTTEIFISPGFRLRSGGRAADQLSSAPVKPVDAGERLCRPGARSGCIPPCGQDADTGFSVMATVCSLALGAGRLREVTPGMVAEARGPLSVDPDLAFLTGSLTVLALFERKLSLFVGGVARAANKTPAVGIKRSTGEEN